MSGLLPGLRSLLLKKKFEASTLPAFLSKFVFEPTYLLSELVITPAEFGEFDHARLMRVVKFIESPTAGQPSFPLDNESSGNVEIDLE